MLTPLHIGVSENWKPQGKCRIPLAGFFEDAGGPYHCHEIPFQKLSFTKVDETLSFAKVDATASSLRRSC